MGAGEFCVVFGGGFRDGWWADKLGLWIEQGKTRRRGSLRLRGVWVRLRLSLLLGRVADVLPLSSWWYRWARWKPWRYVRTIYMQSTLSASVFRARGTELR